MRLDSAACHEESTMLYTGCGLAARTDMPRESKAKGGSVYLFFKRLSDIFLSVLAVLVLSPLLLLTALAVKLDSKGKVIYSQPRAGKDGKIFKMYKFRSMCEGADEKLWELQNLNEMDGPVFKMTDDPRITRVGRIIRKKSIDELPQLINIIMGDMSIVGPRPPLLNEVEQYTRYQLQRLRVKPGLICYWQISGRSNLDFADWVRLDLKYIGERSLWTDFKIILKNDSGCAAGLGSVLSIGSVVSMNSGDIA